MKDYQPLLFTGTLWLLILLAAMLKIRDLSHEVDELKAKEPIIIYQVDNAGGLMFGQITDKEIINETQNCWREWNEQAKIFYRHNKQFNTICQKSRGINTRYI